MLDYPNEEMCRCYGTRHNEVCRHCANWDGKFCKKTTMRKKCPPWGTACGKFEAQAYAFRIT